MSILGKSYKRVDALGKVTGETLYPGDLEMEGQTYMKILFAHRPHAIVKKIDTSKAEALDGVLLVLTAKDVPVNEYGLIFPDQPVLCGPGSSKVDGDHVRFEGDQVAAIIAETEEIADKARSLIEVEYEDLPITSNPEKSMKDDADLLHPDTESNVITHYKIRKGDIESAFEKSDVIIEGEYRTPFQEHAFLAPEAGIAYVDEEDRITVAVAGQWIHEEAEGIAHALDLPLEQIRVIQPAIGGAFGGREDMSVQIVLALTVMKFREMGINRPVKIVWTREESMIGHHKRHPYLIRAKWGASKEGKILAAESEVIEDAGAYNYTSNKVLGNATLMVSGPYVIDNLKVDSYAVYTNNIPGGAFRGFGGPQAAFAAEQQMNKIAQALGMDEVELRLKNIVKDGSIMHTQTPFPSPVTMDRVIEECAEAAKWPRVMESTDSSIKRGIGFACGFKNVGFSFGAPERSYATIEIHGGSEIERVVLHQAGSDVGQGAHTVFQQMAAEAVGVPFEMVELQVADSAVTGDSGSSSASRMTFMAGNAIKGAAKLALEMWEDEDRPVIAEYKYVPPATTPYDKQTGEAMPNFAYGYVAETVEVEVDMDTGEIKIVNVLCANDVGKALNPIQIVGQIEGAVVQAAGYTMMENFISEESRVKTDKFSTYLIPTVLDIPETIDSLVLEFNDEEGPWGARGMGEMPFIPFAPAVTAAVHQATGIWFDSFPLTPEKVLRGLGKI
ncbi:MAG: molybdopterin-dependent oxidoreductase [Chloroflexi bacterium]|jgi:CO/xanthine dehydrogenase Mo-binding subunit|nr:molybdopterin-dependent oxidoreductase [Chloroflexota bacterium]MBT3670777.1 molybdopterin-dependent oxidoreductase [Chloroflexota bacterium]MBT4004391.1 molybdopterin-dependent oxidoreductase [Chloroflexota bacterium]MBT4305145.1 molybdopterin-dependent oxidoreductase [Chloroflexota bacterium]MBT4533333.1 molybdopterin-dependent oxidoreductase [Chloroflexota bacterium]